MIGGSLRGQPSIDLAVHVVDEQQHRISSASVVAFNLGIKTCASSARGLVTSRLRATPSLDTRAVVDRHSLCQMKLASLRRIGRGLVGRPSPTMTGVSERRRA
jgi:hypothetical protein